VIEEVSNMQWGVHATTEEAASIICYSCRGRDLSSCWTPTLQIAPPLICLGIVRGAVGPVSRGKAFVPCTKDGMYCGGNSRRVQWTVRHVATDLSLDTLVERNGLMLSSLCRVYLSLDVRFGTGFRR
jgi:hypothetical protein